MPELPEVETMCRCVGPIVGSRIVDLRRPKSRFQPIKITPRLADFRRRVVGRDIVAVRRLGKRVVVELSGEGPDKATSDHGDLMVFEPRMSGLVLLADPPDVDHLRLVVDLQGGRFPQLLFWDKRGLGVVWLLSPGLFRRRFGPEKLGPDALEIPADLLRQRLAASGRAIKVALLDQGVLAGIGNLYASEILHRSRIHPGLSCRDLTPNQWDRLHAVMGEVLLEAIAHQGSTLRDGTYRIARNQPGNYQLCHRVYQRTGQPCLQCATGRIVRIVQAQRSTFFCPACQPAAPPGLDTR